jgi:hypothetical protein
MAAATTWVEDTKPTVKRIQATTAAATTTGAGETIKAAATTIGVEETKIAADNMEAAAAT